MTKYEMILTVWNTFLTLWVFVHGLKFALIQRILNSIVNILAAKRKSKVDALYGRD